MEITSGPAGHGRLPRGQVLSPGQVADQLGHPLAALGEGAHGEPHVEYGYTAGDWPRLDNAMLTYSQPWLCVETTLRARRQQSLDDAARGALSGLRLNVEFEAAVPPDVDEWMLRVLDEGAKLAPCGDAPAATIDGTPYVRVVVDDGTYQAWALDTGRVWVTVAGRRDHLEPVQLVWWQPALTP